ncbi:MAG: hypothetical protein DCC71_03875 [Proteobacteria bacterium]|nr:MAG: hypothetical protein DCC71_03875 [Pseudomonadota bacterium]
MSRFASLFGLGLALGLAAGTATAAEVRGRVTEADPEKQTFTIRTSDGGMRSFRVDGSTVTRKDAQVHSFGDIAEGDQVIVVTETEALANEKPVATRVDVLEGSASTDPGPEGANVGGVGSGTVQGEHTGAPNEGADPARTGKPDPHSD